MGWGNKAIEIRSAETGHLDGVFMHKRSQQLRFLCERNDKVRTLTLKHFYYRKIVASRVYTTTKRIVLLEKMFLAKWFNLYC